MKIPYWEQWPHVLEMQQFTPGQLMAIIRHAYILGVWHFYGREFMVTPDVLVPRPATEALIDQAKEAITNLADHIQRPITIADVGTGSGCIAVTLALELSSHVLGHVFATDISHAALKIAAQNAARYELENRITFLHGDMLSPLMNKKIDLIVSNPPYVPAESLAAAGHATDTIGLLFEPRLALDGGVSGTDFTNILTNNLIPAIYETVGGKVLHHRGC